MAPFATFPELRNANVEVRRERILNRISHASDIERSMDAIRRSWENLARTQQIFDGVSPSIRLVQEIGKLVETILQQEQELIRQRDDGSMLSRIGHGLG